MAKVNSEKKYVTFVKGLITEASPLTYPENASLDEDNFHLKIDGSRQRRLGIDYEPSFGLKDTAINAATMKGTRQSFHRWDFPAGSTEVSIGVVRAYNSLWFVNLLHASPSSAAALLNGGNPIVIAGLANAEIETIDITGFLIIVGEDISLPILLIYDKSTEAVSQTIIPIQTRDFTGLDDGLDTTKRPVTLDVYGDHEYNLLNQGWNSKISTTCGLPILVPATGYWRGGGRGAPRVWVETAAIVYGTQSAVIACTKTILGVFPSNSDTWSYGKTGTTNADGTDSAGNFEKYSPLLMERNSLFSEAAPKGAFILDAFSRGVSRRHLTGLNSLSADDEEGRLTTIASYAGRLFYSGVTSRITGGDLYSPNYSGYIFFSQQVVGEDKLGKCYQEADPTSPDISDIVDTDGGTIQFPEITKIVKLVNVKDSLIVFAENGIWEIYGDTGGFKATSFQIAKIANTGISNSKAVIVAGDTIVYWAKAGIFVLVQEPMTGRYNPQNLSLTTIQSEYNNIPDLAKRNARGFFDEKENRIRWLYNDEAGYAETNYITNYNRVLTLDLLLKAFFKSSFSNLATNSPRVVDFVELPNHSIGVLQQDVYVGNDNIVAGALQVQIPDTQAINRAEDYSLLVFRGASFTLAKQNNKSFVDWKLADGTGVDFSSYLITGYDTFGDIMRNKQVPYIWFYFNRTEDGFTETLGILSANNPSGCLVQAQWNWANSNAQGKWGTPFEAYRYIKNYIPSGEADTFATGDTVIVTKSKLRGSGRALSLKISSVSGKDMQLLGWAHLVSGDGTP